MTRSRWILVILAGSALACNGDRKEPARTDSPPAPEVVPAGIVAPAQKTASISIEGQPQNMTLALYHPASAPFYTYVPTDMVTEARVGNYGVGHYFFAAFNGKVRDDAYLLLFIFKRGATREEIAAIAKVFEAGHKHAGYFHKLDVRLHNDDQYYYIAQYYPNEFADGLGPRIQRILDEWQWVDVVTSPPRP